MSSNVRRRRLALAAALAIVLVGVASAHEEHGNTVMGTVTAIHKDTNQVEVKATDGHVTAFKLDDKTKYVRGAKVASLDDIKVGERVVATLAGEGDVRTATLVKLPKGTAASKSKSDEKAKASER